MANPRAETSKCTQSLTKSPQRKKSEAKEALRQGASIKEAALVSGMNSDYLCHLIKSQTDFRKAKLQGDEAAIGLIETSMAKILADPEEKASDKVSAAAMLARYKRLGGFASEKVEVLILPPTVLEAIK